jgi:photosystem II stability/assembly factor-like uncharacterized protein
MISKSLLRFAALGVLLFASAILNAGVNTWTGARPAGTLEGVPNLVAAHPDDPDIVYAAFGNQLHRSADGGRTWRSLRAFEAIYRLAVHPASASTILVAGQDASVQAVYRSSDAGETWSRTLVGYVTMLAGSPTDASVIFAGASHILYKSTDSGATWSADELSGVMASLVIHPRDPSTAYAGAEGIDYWGLTPGALVKTTDGGETWQVTPIEASEGVSAIAIDVVRPETLYVATGLEFWYDEWEEPSRLLRSEDGGHSWISAGQGLPEAAVRHLAIDPRVSGTLYAGTSKGIYRTRDGGLNWFPLGRQLADVPIRSLSIDGTGRRLRAGTSSGVHDFALASGPIDVAAAPAGASRVLAWDGERRSVGTLDASGAWTSGLAGQSTMTWTAIALAEGGGGGTHVLWQSGDGRSALEIIGTSGRPTVFVFPKRPGWIASDVSVRADGQTHILWTSEDGRMRVASVNASGAVFEGAEIGPAAGWSAVAIADSPEGDAWVLWRSTDGRSALLVYRDGRMVRQYKYAAEPGWSVEDIAVGADGRPGGGVGRGPGGRPPRPAAAPPDDRRRGRVRGDGRCRGTTGFLRGAQAYGFRAPAHCRGSRRAHPAALRKRRRSWRASPPRVRQHAGCPPRAASPGGSRRHDDVGARGGSGARRCGQAHPRPRRRV